MEILWLILKIIGIILLVIIGLLLLAVILVVFYPVSYTLYADYEEKLCAKAKVRWLFRLISVTFDYNIERKKCILRIMGIPVMDFLNPKPAKVKKEKPKKRRSPKPSQKKAESSQVSNASSNAENDFMQTQNASAQTEHDFVQSEADRVQTEYGSEQTGTDSKQTEQKKAGKLKALFAKIQSFPAKFKMFFINLWEKLKSLKEQLSDIKDTVDQWIEILSREQTKTAISKAKNHIIGLLKHILPRKWKAYAEFGFEDPALTGKLLGYYWMFIGLWGEHFICVPDFENKVFKGNIHAKGHIQVIKFIYIAWQFLFDKDLVYLRKLNSEIKPKKD